VEEFRVISAPTGAILLQAGKSKLLSFYPAIAIVGPTAAGKSLLGSILANRFSGEIVSCDALQIYRGMDIGTAKLARTERERIPHHMMDLRNPDEEFSAGDYLRLAREALREIKHRKHTPFVVGGSGFYLRALIDGFFEGPWRSEEIRCRLRRIVERKGAEYLHERLRRVDPETAGSVAPADVLRIVRAYEMYLLTGKTMHWWQRQARNSLPGFRWPKLCTSRPRDRLYERINTRVEEMFRQGIVEEVQRLIETYPKDCRAFKAIGYRQSIAHIEGRISLAQAVSDTQQATRNYAKRQLTWFRADKEIVWLEAAQDLSDTADQASRQIRAFLNS
jgi:tRNA dimethylallyltransferase